MRLYFYLLIVCLSLANTAVFAQKKQVLNGYIRENGSRESLIGANVWVESLRTGTTSNAYGFYSLQLPAGQHEIRISYVGYETQFLLVDMDSSRQLDVFLEKAYNLQEIIVSDEGVNNVSEQTQMSQMQLNSEQVKNTPTLLGEKDVLKTLQLLPGIQSGSEGQTGLYVRGGGPDQNLILVDEATVYNASHLFGFFSVFNGDAIKNVTLTKGGFPARYGGRLSSVVDITMKDGDQSEYKGELGVGLISARGTVEGPIIKDKASFIISARRTYYDLLLAPFLSVATLGEVSSGYYFYDFNAKINYQINRKNRLYLSTYTGKDRFFTRYDDSDALFETDFYWGNLTATLRWNHQYSDKVFFNSSLIFSDFTLSSGTEFGDDVEFFSLRYQSAVRDIGAKFDADLLLSNKHRLRSGAQLTSHVFTPSALVLRNTIVPEANADRILQDPSIEAAAYLEDNFKATEKIDLILGLRFSYFNAQQKHYFRPEPRLSTRYQLDSLKSVKLSYSAMNQYLHLLSNTGIGLPTDLWVPATERVGPQRAQQIALGFAQNWPEYGLSLEVEGYYKNSRNVLSYLPGASFLFDGLLLFEGDESGPTRNFDWEDQVTSGQSNAYGIEFFLQKPQGRFNGWLGYTLSRTTLQFEEINFGNPFPARYDRRHDLSINTFYHLREPAGKSNGIKLSAVFVFGTGNAITVPKGEFNINPYFAPGVSNAPFMYGPGATFIEYGQINDYRMANYHRLDIGIQFTKEKSFGERTLDISIYNVYNRMNPWIIMTQYENNRNIFVQYSLFGILPTITYSLKF
jgi:hypothetical protein